MIRLLCVCAALIAALAGCAGAPGPVSPDVRTGGALPDSPRTVEGAVPLSDALIMTHADQARLLQEALDRFFAPWSPDHVIRPPEEAFWGVEVFGKKKGFAENLQPYPRERWDRLVALQDMAAYPSRAVPAVITRNTAQRVLPSNRPFFLDPALPGEGFPFDYFQNSALWLGTPVLVTHASLDGAWLFVETGFSYGWIRREDAATVDDAFMAGYRNGDMAAVLGDDTPLAQGDAYLGQAHIGAIFPVHATRSDGLEVMVPLRDADGRAKIGLAALTHSQAAPMPLPWTSRTAARLADAMAGQLYGWGGMFENRDCSAAMRDLLLPFGIWLPRNSSMQARTGAVVEFDGMTPREKLDVIGTQGRPFSTLIWMPGHIGLYLGRDARGEPLMLHNIWGVRTILPSGAEGRAIIGRLAVTTLRPAEERNDVAADSFLNRVGGITFLAPHGPSAP
jgi:hypothetical protein